MEVWDDDFVSKDDSLGGLKIDLTGLPPGKGKTVMLPLHEGTMNDEIKNWDYYNLVDGKLDKSHPVAKSLTRLTSGYVTTAAAMSPMSRAPTDYPKGTSKSALTKKRPDTRGDRRALAQKRTSCCFFLMNCVALAPIMGAIELELEFIKL
mmetsp:Transcript_10209/g.18614  ORF Transcript_10209/g.18614 Transcript_10209/m.18614 type:complete len:150 (-) Transcript_10209:30-479(-)